MDNSHNGFNGKYLRPFRSALSCIKENWNNGNIPLAMVILVTILWVLLVLTNNFQTDQRF